jgi:hypothetical protein
MRIGANLPWIHYGGDFGANAWRPAGGVHASPDELARALGRVAAAGIRRIRWFMLCDGRAGIRFGSRGEPNGLDDVVFADLDAAVSAAGEQGIQIMFVLFDFLWCATPRRVAGVPIGGHARVLRDSAMRNALLARVVAPILERYGRDPRIVAWDLINEPEWVTRGLGARWWRAAVPVDAMQAFVRDAAVLIHRHTNQAATLGSAWARWSRAWVGLGLDVYQTHWYPRFERRTPLARPVSALELDRPVVLGEFPSRVAAPELRRLIDTAREAGYAEAYIWSVMAEDSATDFASAEAVFRQSNDVRI